MTRTLATFALLFGLLLAQPLPTSADVYILKTGSVVEGKTLRVYPKKMPGQGGPKNVFVIKNEAGKEVEINEVDLSYVVKGPLSWEVRAASQAWYAKESPAVKDDWKAHEAFAKKCAAKKYLEEQTQKHYRKAYELRKPSIKDDVSSHTTVAKQLETEWDLYDEAKEEWRWVYAKRKETSTGAEALVTLARWCMDEGLYDEAADAFNEALKLNAAHDGAKRGLRHLENSPKVNSQFFRSLNGKLTGMVNLLESKRKGDGSYGSDITEAAVHGHHAMTALVGLTLLAKWDFNAIKTPARWTPFRPRSRRSSPTSA